MSGAQDGDANAGWISLGTAGAGGAEFPPSGAAGKIHVAPKGGNKLQKATGAGKSGAKTTINGTKVAEFIVKYSYPDREPHATLWESALAIVSPYNGAQGAASGADAWDLSHRFAAMYGATACLVDEIDGPTPKEGSDEMTGTIKLSIWTKPDNSGAGVGTTPATPAPYSPSALPPLFAARGAAKDAAGNPILPSTPGAAP